MRRPLLLRASRNGWLRVGGPRSRLGRRAVLRFVPGEDLSAAIAAGDDLLRSGRTPILSYLGENVTEPAEADATAREYASAIERLRPLSGSGEVSLKLTQLGLDLDVTSCYERVQGLVHRAHAAAVFVWIDMEASEYTDATLSVYRRLRSDYANVGVCLQAYLYRSLADLQSLLPLSPSIRIVKGAYAEPPEIAYPVQRDVVTSFLALASEALRHQLREGGVRIAFGTHDDRLIRQVVQIAERSGVGRDAYEIQLLYGIRDRTSASS
jgi:proline dehydrogenase